MFQSGQPKMRYWIYAGASWLVSFAVILPLITRTEYDSKDGTCIVDWSSKKDDSESSKDSPDKANSLMEKSIFGSMMEDTSENNSLTDCSGRTYMYLEKLYIFAIGGKFINDIREQRLPQSQKDPLGQNEKCESTV